MQHEMYIKKSLKIELIWLIVLNATFSNISAILWQPVLVVEEAGTSDNHTMYVLPTGPEEYWGCIIYIFYNRLNMRTHTCILQKPMPSRSWLCSNPIHVEVYSIQHYVIKFVKDCLKDSEGYRVVLIFFPNKLLNIKSNSVTFRF
jgi:hypothetical protein